MGHDFAADYARLDAQDARLDALEARLRALEALEAAVRDHSEWLERQGFHWTALAFRLLLDGKPNDFDFGSGAWTP